LHGIEVEKVGTEYIIPFIGKETPWWNGTTNRNIFTGKTFKMFAKAISNREITIEDIEINTNVSNILVEKKPYYIPSQHSFNPSEDVYYLIRYEPDIILNPSVTNVYEVIQHKEVLNRAEKLRSEFPNKLQYYSSGVLFQGRMFWVQLEQKVEAVVEGDDLLLTLMFLSNHKGANAIYSTITRVVCDNTLKMSLSNFNQRYLISHKGNTNQNYENLLNSFNVEDFSFQETVKLYQYWNSLDLSSKDIVDLVRYSLELEETEKYQDNYLFKETMRLIEEQKGVELLKGKYSAYRVFNALTEVTHFIRGSNKIYDSIFGKVNNISKRFAKAVSKK
jgi:hypothetical protein